MGRLGIAVQVANTSDDAWRWRKVKQKDDRRDALKAARLSAVNQLREVYIPQTEIRQWRALIAYRQHLVGRRTKIKNHIRDLLVREGQILARGRSCWNKFGPGITSQYGAAIGGGRTSGAMARRVMGRVATAANDADTNRERRRDVECDWRGGHTGAVVTHCSRSRVRDWRKQLWHCWISRSAFGKQVK